MLLVQYFTTLIFIYFGNTCIFSDKIHLVSSHSEVASESPSPYDFISSLKLKRSATISFVTTTPFIATTDATFSSDLLCNNETEFVCICQHITGNLIQHYILCNQLIEMEDLPIIEMNIRRVNLSARLHTNETYESYFKRRIAAIVSTYCEQQVDECLATTLRLKRENVVLLSVRPSELQSTTIGFVITKSQRRSMLGAGTIVNSIKVKYILSAQLAALSRVLGGVRIERVDIATLQKYDKGDFRNAQRNNTHLLIIVSIVATFLVVTYIIAAIRICRDCSTKKHAQKVIKLNKATEAPNYGTCIHRNKDEMGICHEAQAAVKNRTVPENLQSPSSQQSSGSAGETTVMDFYQMKRMFQCDPSQLPAEETLSLSQISGDLPMIHLSRSAPETIETLYSINKGEFGPKITKLETEQENLAPSQKLDELFQENDIFVEIPHINVRLSKETEPTTGKTKNQTRNSADYLIQPQDGYFEKQATGTTTVIYNVSKKKIQLHGTEINQTENNSKPINLTWNRSMTVETIDKALDQETETVKSHNSACFQPTTTDESAWLVEEVFADSPYSPSNFVSKSSLDPSGSHKEMAVLELHKANPKIASEITSGTACLERISLPSRLNSLQSSKSPNLLDKNAENAKISQKSGTNCNHTSSESDNADGDVYCKLSEAEEEIEAGAKPKSVALNYSENMEIFVNKRNHSDRNLEKHIDSQSLSDCTRPFTADSDEMCYERLQESPTTPSFFILNPTSDELTLQQLVDSTFTSALK